MKEIKDLAFKTTSTKYNTRLKTNLKSGSQATKAPNKDKTKCLSCGTIYHKQRFLIDSCGICRSKNIHEVKQ